MINWTYLEVRSWSTLYSDRFTHLHIERPAVIRRVKRCELSVVTQRSSCDDTKIGWVADYPVLDSDRDYHLLLAVISTTNSGRKMAGAFLMAAKLVSEEKKSGAEKSSKFIKTGFWWFLLFIKVVLENPEILRQTKRNIQGATYHTSFIKYAS